MTRASEQIEAQAAEWLIRADLAGSPERWSALDVWLASSPRHRAAFLRLSVAWRRAEQLRNYKAFDGSVDPDLLSPKALRARKVAARRKLWRQPQWVLGLRTASAAAALAAVYLLAPRVVDYFDRPVHTTQIGGLERIRLADGSTIDLNTDSRLRVDFSDARRQITLMRGEAAFKVAHDPGRPFEVQAGNTTLRVLGTAFSVRLRDSLQVHVSVTEGKVAVDPPSSKVLTPGHALTVAGQRTTLARVPVDTLTKRLLWTQGRLFFSGETLTAAVSEFNRYNRERLVVVDPRFADMEVSGTFVATDPRKFVIAARSFPEARESRSAVVRLEGKDRR